MSTLLPTSIVGSLPKPSWLSEPETLWSPWRLEGAELDEGRRDALHLAAAEQAVAGLDVISDGEQTRQHFVTTFIEHLSGVDFARRETVRIRDRYDASVPTVVGPVRRERPVFVDDAASLRTRTDKPLKWALPGPMTMIDTLYDANYGSREELAREFAALLNQEARGLEAAGGDWGVEVLERAAEGLRAETVVHICYGYGIKANTDWKASLGTEWRQYEETSPLLRDSVIDTVSLESRGSHVPMELVELLRGKKVMLGAIDVADPRVETPEEVADTLRRALAFVEPENLCPSTNCGMAPLSRTVAQGKMRALAAGTALLRAELAGG